MLDILVPITFFTMIFGIVYLRSRERMAMIEKGISPQAVDGRPRPFVNLKWGLLLLGSGTGLLISYLLSTFVLIHEPPLAGHHPGQGFYNPVFLYFALIAIGGGSGLIISYRIEKKEWMETVKNGVTRETGSMPGK